MGTKREEFLCGPWSYNRGIIPNLVFNQRGKGHYTENYPSPKFDQAIRYIKINLIQIDLYKVTVSKISTLFFAIANLRKQLIMPNNKNYVLQYK